MQKANTIAVACLGGPAHGKSVAVAAGTASYRHPIYWNPAGGPPRSGDGPSDFRYRLADLIDPAGTRRVLFVPADMSDSDVIRRLRATGV